MAIKVIPADTSIREQVARATADGFEFVPDSWEPVRDMTRPIVSWGARSKVTRKGARILVSKAGAPGSTRNYYWQRAEYERCAKLGSFGPTLADCDRRETLPSIPLGVAASAVAVPVRETPVKRAKKFKRTFTEAERAEYRDAKRAEAAELLKRAAQELLTSDGWLRWAECRARFRRYSVANTWLIMVQSGGSATMVASFKRWKEMGRQVKKGGRSLKIFAPMMRKPNDEEIARGADPNKQVLGGFRLVPVFDVSATEGEPLPLPPSEPLTGDSHADYLPVLVSYAESLGYSVSFEDLSGQEVGGWCDPILKRIVVDSSGAANAQLRTLVHEVAHALGVGYKDYGRSAAKCIVETATFIVCQGLGLDTSGVSVSYVAGWGESDNLKAVETFAGVVDEVARKIETTLAKVKIAVAA